MTELPVEERLFESMDKAALAFIAILESTDEQYTLEDRMRVFNLGRDWLIRRAKLKPKPEEDGSPGVEEIKRLIAEAATQGGYTRTPPVKRGRPAKAVSDARKAARTSKEVRQDNDDDSGLRKLLGKNGAAQ